MKDIAVRHAGGPDSLSLIVWTPPRFSAASRCIQPSAVKHADCTWLLITKHQRSGYPGTSKRPRDRHEIEQPDP